MGQVHLVDPLWSHVLERERERDIDCNTEWTVHVANGAD